LFTGSRLVDTDVSTPSYADVAENRVALDGKWDLGLGLWFEGASINKSKDIGVLTT
jgi:hypothetical protein